MSKKITIVGFGASITAAREMIEESKRWLNILGEKLQKRFPEYEFEIINSGKGGKSARELMAAFESEVLFHDPDFVILDLCANNMSPARSEEDRVDLKEFKNILEEYKSSLPQKTKTVIFTTPPIPPIYQDLHPYGKNPAFKEFYQKHGGFGNIGSLYKDIFKNFAKENNFPIYDFHNELFGAWQKKRQGKIHFQRRHSFE